MTDEDAPAEAGTSEEQHETDGSGIPVEAVAEGEAEQEQEDEQDMAGELDEAIEMLEALRDDDPENIGAIALVVNTKNGMPASLYEDDERVEDGERPDGTTWRVVNSDLTGYDETSDVVATLAGFNSGLEDAEVLMEQPRGPMGLGAMLGME